MPGEPLFEISLEDLELAERTTDTPPPVENLDPGPANFGSGSSSKPRSIVAMEVEALVQEQRLIADGFIEVAHARQASEATVQRDRDSANGTADRELKIQIAAADAVLASAVSAADARVKAGAAQSGVSREAVEALRADCVAWGSMALSPADGTRCAAEGSESAPREGFQNPATHLQAAREAAQVLRSKLGTSLSTGYGAGKATAPTPVWEIAAGIVLGAIGAAIFGAIGAAAGAVGILYIGAIGGFLLGFVPLHRSNAAARKAAVVGAFRALTVAERAIDASMRVWEVEADSAKREAQLIRSRAVEAAKHLALQTGAEAERTFTEARRGTAETAARALESLGEAVDGYAKRVDKLAPTWSPDPQAFATWQPVAQGHAVLLRLGEHRMSVNGTEFRWPAVLAFPQSGAIAIFADAERRQTATSSTQSIFLQLLMRSRPGLLRFLFLDPVALGDNVGPFMTLREVEDGNLVNGKAWSEPRDIERELVSLNDRVSDIIQRLPAALHDSIVDFNEAAVVKEHFVAVGVYDFPANFHDEAGRRLEGLVNTGPRCGVVPVIVVDPTKELPRGISPATKASVRLSNSGDVWRWEGFAAGVELILDRPPAPAVMRDIVAKVAAAARGSGVVEVDFEHYLPAPEARWTTDSRSGLEVTLGPRAGTHQPLVVTIGRGGAHHGIVVGQTGSGKSTLLHALIMGLATKYSPSELELYLIDFKGGVEFKPYAEHRLPHARVVAIESEPEFGLSVLQGLVAEQRRREVLFRDEGVQDIEQYEIRSGGSLTRIVLIVDEFQEFFREDGKVSDLAATSLDLLVRQARSFGIHVFLASQSLAGKNKLSQSSLDQMQIRIALMCSVTDSQLVLGDKNPAAQRLTRPGQAIFNDDRGLPERNEEFQCAFLTDEVREASIVALRARAEAHPDLYPPRAPRVFEGRKAANFDDNLEFQSLVLRSPSAAPTSPGAWVGEPIAIKPPIRVQFRREGGRNLLIVSDREDAALAMIRTTILSLSAQLPSVSPGEIAIIDVRPEDSVFSGFFEELTADADGKVTLAGRAALAGTIERISGIVKERLAGDGEPSGKVFVIVAALHRARDLRKDDNGPSFGSLMNFDAPPPADPPSKLFSGILRDGPAVGVHVIAWCDSVANVNRTLEYQLLREFGFRIGMQMSRDDSQALLDTPGAQSLGESRALFFADDGREVEKFRPYGLPKGWQDRFAAYQQTEL